MRLPLPLLGLAGATAAAAAAAVAPASPSSGSRSSSCGSRSSASHRAGSVPPGAPGHCQPRGPPPTNIHPFRGGHIYTQATRATTRHADHTHTHTHTHTLHTKTHTHTHTHTHRYTMCYSRLQLCEHVKLHTYWFKAE